MTEKNRNKPFKPLEACKQTLSYISVGSPEENTAKWKKLLFKVLPLVTIVTVSTALIGSILFFSRSVSTDLESCLNGLYQLAGLMGIMNSIIVTIFTHHKLLAIFESLEKIYRASSNDEIFPIWVEKSQRSEWALRLVKIFTVTGSIFSCALLPFASVLFLLIEKKQYEFDAVYHTYHFLLPWNRETPLGYFYEICFNIALCHAYFFACGLELVLFISVCWHQQAFYKIFLHTVRILDSPNNKRSDKVKVLRELIQFHNSIKGWFSETASFFSPFILAKMITFMIYLASSAFQFDLVNNNNEVLLKHILFTLSLLLCTLVHSIANLLFYCLFGKWATESFENMADCLYESNWRELPIDLQKFFIPMITNAQKPLNYHGFGMIYLNLGTFTKMIKSVFSYYMMFKTFTK